MGWRTAYASEIGTSHIADGTPCQDHNLVDESGDCLIVAVADGAGSAKHSKRGAQVACSSAVHRLKIEIGQSEDGASCTAQNMRAAFECARQEVEAEAAREGAECRDFASTLLVAVIGSTGSVFGQVGDGAVIYDAGDGLSLTHWPEQEMLNLTDFLTTGTLDDTLVINSVQGTIDRLVMMTDGLTQLLLDFRSRTPHAPALERLLGACSTACDPGGLNDDLRRFLNSDTVNIRSDDDKTLVLACREPIQ